MAVKVVNDTSGSNSLILTLLVYGAYSRMTDLDPATLTMTQCAKAIKQAIKEIMKIRAKKQVETALNH